MIQFIVKQQESGLYYIVKEFDQTEKEYKPWEATEELVMLDIDCEEDAYRLAQHYADLEPAQAHVA